MIKDRLSALEKRIDKLTPCGMTVTLKDGRQIVTNGGGAIDLLWAGESIVRAVDNTGGNGMLSTLLEALAQEGTDDPQIGDMIP